MSGEPTNTRVLSSPHLPLHTQSARPSPPLRPPFSPLAAQHHKRSPFQVHIRAYLVLPPGEASANFLQHLKVTLYSPSWWAHLWVRPTQRMDWKEPKGKTEKNLPSWWELMVTWVGTVGTEKKSKFKKPQRRHAGPNVGGREDPRCLSWATGLLAAPHRHHSASAAFSGLRNHTLMFTSFASDQEHLAQFMSYYPY